MGVLISVREPRILLYTLIVANIFLNFKYRGKKIKSVFC